MNESCLVKRRLGQRVILKVKTFSVFAGGHRVPGPDKALTIPARWFQNKFFNYYQSSSLPCLLFINLYATNKIARRVAPYSLTAALFVLPLIGDRFGPFGSYTDDK